MREYEKALKAFEQALKLAPDIAKIHVDMAGVLFYIYKDYQKSGLLYKKAAELDKRYKAVYHHKARQLFDRAHDLFIRCQFHGFQEERNEAITAFQQVLLFDPTHERAKQALSELQNTRTSVTYSSFYFFDDFYSYQSQPSRSQLEREAMENNQWDLRPSIHPANCRCAQCWEP